MAKLVSGIVSQVAEWLFVPIRQRISHVYNHKSNMDRLKEQKEQLEDQRDKVQIDAETAERRGDKIHKKVQRWLEKVDKVIQEAMDVISKSNEVELDSTDVIRLFVLKRCWQWHAPNLMRHYSLSKKAVQLLKNCGTLLKEGEFEEVSYRDPPPGSESMDVQACETFASRVPIFNDVMEKLRDRDVNMIGIHGMGGVGKTTLVQKIAAQASIDGLFNEVVVVEVKKDWEIKTIQDQIADQIGLEFKAKIVESRASELRARLKKEKSVLIVLDNLWGEFNLDKVGIPFGEVQISNLSQIEEHLKGRKDDNNCKIILTSRDAHVINVMKTEKSESFSIMPLSDAEAADLFWKLLGDSTQKLELEDVAIKVVHKCAGLPLAISTISKALKGRSKNYWEYALDQLEASNVEDFYAPVYSAIRLSYEALKQDAKSLFWLFGLYDEGRDISVTYLIRYGMGMGLFKNANTLKQGRTLVVALIEDLKAANLLLDGKNGEVEMHDVTHVVAKKIAAENLMFNMEKVDNLREELEKEGYKNSTAISLPCGNTTELPERLECPELECFLFFRNPTSTLLIPNTFFEGLEKLKALHLAQFSLLTLPLSFGNLSHLHTLSLDYCQLSDVRMIGKLSKLEFLSFHGSDIETVPQEIGQLTQLLLLDLTSCSKLKVISPAVLSSLSRLEELQIDESFVQWEVEGLNNASLSELMVLHDLATLHIHVNDAETMPSDLIFEKLERYNILIGDVWDSYGVSKASRVLKLKLNNKNYLGHGVVKLLKGAEDLHLDELNGVRNVHPQLNQEDFSNLKHFHVQNDRYISYIIGEEQIACDVFPKLESLFLYNLINLEEICPEHFNVKCFAKLKDIKVENCDGLKYLFSSSKPFFFGQLQEIEVKNCNSIKEIVHEGSEGSRIEFCQLHTLTLKCLQNFSGFGLVTNASSEEITLADDHVDFMTLFGKKVAFPTLKNLNLSSLDIKTIWLDQLPAETSFGRSLTNLVVKDCSKLKCVFSYSMVESLEQLQNLEICNCELIETIMSDLRESVGEIQMANMRFPKLLYLKLEGLPKLTRFGSECLIEFPSLNDLEIENCPNLTTLSSSSTYENTNPSLLEKVELPALEKLLLSSISCEMIWHIQHPITSRIQHLTTLTMDGLHSLKYLFSSSTFEYLIKLRVLQISNCSSMEAIIAVEEETANKKLVSKLRRLDLKNLPQLTRFCHFNENLVKLNSMTVLWIEHCPNMETFISNSTRGDNIPSKDSGEKTLFAKKVELPSLQFLLLQHLDKLRKIWHDQLTSDSFPELRVLFIESCHKILNVFSINMWGGIQRLEVLAFCDCMLLEEICYVPKITSVMMETNTAVEEELVNLVPRFIFPQLTMLKLADLPKLRSFYSGNHVLEWPMLKTLEVWGCDEVEILTSELMRGQETHEEGPHDIPVQQPLFLVDQVAFPSLEVLQLLRMPKLLHLWRGNSPSQGVFPSLKILEVSYCHGLINLTSLCPAKSLFHVTRLKIVSCISLETIITDLEDDDANAPTVFKELKDLELRDLRSLKGFYLGNHTLVFPSLIRVVVIQCPNMITFSRGNIGTPKLQGVKLTEGEDDVRWESDLNTTVQLLFEEMVGFRDFKVLDLSYFPYLRERWNDQIPFSLFSNLTWLMVAKCANISSAIPVNLLPFLNNLRVFTVEDCEMLEEVFYLEEFNADIHSELLSQLDVFSLTELPKLRRIWNTHHLEILGFTSLKSLCIKKCDSLRYIFTTTIILGLKKLQMVRIKDCALVEEIIRGDRENDEAMNVISVSLLNSIILESLPNLKSFCSRNNVFECPSLKNVTITDCPELKTFVFTSTKDVNLCDTLLFHDQVELPAIRLPITSRIQHLTTLVMDGLHYLKYLFWSSIFECLIKLRVLQISNCSSMEAIIAVEEETANKKLVSKLCRLDLKNLPQLIRFCDFNGNLIELSSLTALRIEHCPNMETFISNSTSGDRTPSKDSDEQTLFARKVEFPSLQFLHLQHLDKLRKIWDDQLRLDSFSELRKLSIISCRKILNVFPIDMRGRFRRLEMLHFGSCKSLEEICYVPEVTPMILETNTVVEEKQLNLVPARFVFPKLTRLTLMYLPKLRSFYSGKHVLEWPMLETLQIWGCDEVEILTSELMSGHEEGPRDIPVPQPLFLVDQVAFPSLEELDLFMLPKLLHLWKGNSQSREVFPSLKTLEVSYCRGLINLMSLCTAKSLFHLIRLKIDGCKSLETVIADLEDDDVNAQIVFKKLKDLELQDLISLKGFYLGNHTLVFPSLIRVVMMQCPNMSTFSQGVIRTPKLKGVKLTEGEDDVRWESDLNTTVQLLFKEMDAQRRKEAFYTVLRFCI